MGLRRRVVLATIGVTGALVVGWSALPPRQRLVTGRPLPLKNGESALNGWVKVGSDDSVVIQVPKSEMGQGVLTACAMIAADELDADWARVRVEHPPLDAIYNNQAAVVDGLPFHPDSDGALRSLAGWLTAKAMREIGLQMTGGSSTVKDLWLPLREAGAAARAMLVEAAARRWGIKAAECTVSQGRVSHPSGQQARLGELAEAAAALPLPDKPRLKAPEQFKLIGRSLPRLEGAAKAEGRATFGIDTVLPGLLYATVKMCPVLGGSAASFDAAKALALPGVKQVLRVEGRQGGTGGVAVIADTPWHAIKGLQAVEVRWDEGAAATFSSAAAIDELAATLEREQGFALYRQGDAGRAIQGAARTLQAEYRAPWLAHTAMEPMNCTVLFKDGAGTVWASTQVPGIARRAAALALGLPSEKVELHVQLLGGGFGRRLEADFIGQAALVAKAVEGVPVQTFWSRAEDTTHDFYRPACVARWRAGFDAQGRLVGVTGVSAGQTIITHYMQRQFGFPVPGPDKTASEGAFDQPYEWPAARFAHAPVQLPVPVGFWRAVGHSHQAFFKESFVDEIAAALKQDPLAFRLSLLKQHPQHAAVLERAAEKAGWGSPVPPAPDGAKAARGIALHQSFGSIVAQVVEASVAADRKTIRVHRVVCAVDCGTAVNPGLIAQQMESAVIYGLSAALAGEVAIEKGRVQQTNYHDAPALRLDAAPRVETTIVPSHEHPQGVGEPGLPPLAPALANALFALTGQRLRSLPLKLA